ncbi:MAG: ribonuclease J, partial [Eggerthellaceae bacterium]|nr:ribonuclease J [Eggerthellaceae bacterium]
ALAEQTGVPADNIFICENGETLILNADGVKQGDNVQSGVVYVDGLSVGDTSQDVLDERVTLGAQGFAAMAAAVSFVDRKLASPVSIEMHGITGGDDPYVAIEAQEAVENALRRQVAKGATPAELRKVGRDTLLNLLWERTKQRPMCVATILEV